AQRTLQRRAALAAPVEEWNKLNKEATDAAELLDLLAEEEPESAEVAELEGEVEGLLRDLQDIEFKLKLSGENDARNALVHINAGAGGTESQDWAQILMRMYLRWAERRGFTSETLDLLAAEEAGIKSATFAVNGPYAFGYLRPEVGVHRLVRISPFDAASRRHTSFASVFVFPEVADDIEIDIDEGDLKIDTYRSSGAGGQHVNVTDSAVRITHIPSGLVVSCQNERSQHKNKSTAMKVLKARLYDLEKRKKEEELDAIHSGKKQIAFGSQIRSYVLHPYQMVKDHRTNVEMGNVDAVLDGDLDRFIEAYLMEFQEDGS
ncbi:MAG: peptide chain release factor 2, partial [Nitrospinota bacterium]|nr:peptide chain release factor 2 [Nitrospinota bacterium]